MTRFDPADFVPVRGCALCGAASALTRYVDGPFRVLCCGDCGLHWTTPRLRPECYAEVYGPDYWASPSPQHRGYRDYLGADPMHLRTFAVRARALGKLALAKPGSRLLDVGCATGCFMEVMRRRGWECTGIEPSVAAARIGRERYGHRILEGTVESAGLDDRLRFDLVTLWDCVEHLEDPLSTVHNVCGRIVPGGYLVLETQDIDSIFARFLGVKWHHFKHLEHLYHFNRRSLRVLLRKLGLIESRMTRRFAGKYIDMEFLVERSARVSAGMSRWLRLANRAFPRSFYANVFDEWIVIARKPG